MGQEYNAVTHGLYAKEALLPFENRRQYLRFCRQFVKSLFPENEVQAHLARDIAEDAWKIARIDRTISAMQEDIYGRLTPTMVAQVALVPDELHAVAPEWLVDMSHKIARKQQQLHRQIVEQYEHCHENFASIPNLVAIYKQYPQLFWAASELAQHAGKREIINTAIQTLDAVWQQNTKALWKMLEHAHQRSYFYAHWDSIRKIAQPWIESWYFLQAGQNARLGHHQALALKARADFRKQLQAYERLKKNATLFSAAILHYAQDSNRAPIAVAAKPAVGTASCSSTLVQQDALICVAMPAMLGNLGSAFANVSTQAYGH